MEKFSKSFRYFKCLLLGLLGLAPSFSIGQPDIIETGFYSVNHGLSDRIINDILQSSNGFIWLATPTGLNKFDGYEFTIFNDHPNNTNQISASNIKRIEEVAGNSLLIIYENNLVFFDLLDPNSFKTRKINLLPDNGIKGIVRDIHVNPQRKIQVLSQTDSTYNIYQLEAETFSLITQVPVKIERQIIYTNFIQLYSGDFLINDNVFGLKRFDNKGNLVKHFYRKDFSCKSCSMDYPSRTNFLHQAQDSSVWLSFSKTSGVYQLLPNDDKITQFSGLTSRKYYPRVWEDEKNNLLFEQSNSTTKLHSSAGIYCLKNDGEIVNYSFLLLKRDILTDIYSKNFSKNIFIGHDTGFRILQNNQSRVRAFLSQNVEFDDKGVIINDISGDGKGNVFFANDGGSVYSIDVYNDQLSLVQATNEKNNTPLRINNPGALQYDTSGNLLWVISNASNGVGRLNRINTETCIGKPFPYKESIIELAIDSKGMLWLVCENRKHQGKLVSFDPVTERFSTYLDKDGVNPLENAAPLCIAQKQDDLLWIGTENGLFSIDLNTNTAKRYSKSENQNQIGLTSNVVNTIYLDKDGKVWLGTTNGLNILNLQDGDIATYDQSHGLASNAVYGILPDEHGNYWISTSNGLSYFDVKSQLFRNFYQVDGLNHDEFSLNSYYKDQNGRYYFGGVNGLNAFYPKDLLETDDPPKVVLTKFIKFNNRTDKLEIVTQNLNNLKQITIRPFDSYFQFQFILPNFTHSNKNQFSVWLEDFDKDWVYLGNTPTVRYNKLPPGRYTLHIDGTGPNGNWNEDYLSVKINVKPIFYKTWWFVLLCVIFAGALIYGIFQYQLEQRLNVERIRMKLSSDLHDEMSGLLSGIAMQSDILQMMTTDNESKSRLKIIGEVSRKAMSKMSDVIWSIDSRKDKVLDLIQRMHEHAEEILLPLDIKYEMRLGKLDENQKMPVTIRQNLFFIFKEAINNAAKHSKASKVIIQLGNVGNNFEMEIFDDGVGAPHHAPNKTGQGLTNLKMRAQRINANINIINGKGFTIRLNMPKFA